MNAITIENRWVPDPLMTDAEFAHQRAKPVQTPHVGEILVSRNLTTLMGGFCRFRGTEAQQRAAARYKALHAQSQLGGSKAIDPSIEAVDGGRNDPEAIVMMGSEAMAKFTSARELLGRLDCARFDFVVIAERGPTAYARFRFHLSHPNAPEIGRGQVEVRRIADRLAELWGYQSRV